MSIIKVPTSFNIDVEFEIPEFYRRLLALVIDWVILIFYGKIAGALLNALYRGSSYSDVDWIYDLHWITIVVFWVPILLYFLICEITMNGQTVGKKIMALRIVNENGGKASISQFLIRWVTRDIWLCLALINSAFLESKTEALIMVLAVIGYMITDIVMVIASKKGQRLGDLLARTILIRINTRASIEETIFQEVADTYKPQFPQIMQLSDRDINAIKSILETSRKKGDLGMADAASGKIKTHLNIQTNLDPYEFLSVLLKDYNYLSTK